MTEPRILACAQTIAVRGDVDANVHGHVRLVHTAAEHDARLLLFPELSLTGYELDLAEELAFTVGDARLAPLLQAARDAGIALVVGAPVRLLSRLHIGAFLISPDGRVDVVTKQRLGAFSPEINPGGTVPPPEPTVFHPGDSDPFLRAAGFTAAVGICADTSRPEHAASAAARGADAYLASMFVTPADVARDSARLAAYAATHTMTVAMSNYAGSTGGLDAAGCSGIWSSTGERIVALGKSGTGVALAIECDGVWYGRAVMLDDA